VKRQKTRLIFFFLIGLSVIGFNGRGWAQADPHPNNAHTVVHFVWVDITGDDTIKTLKAPFGQTLMGMRYGYDLDDFKARKATFYRDQSLHKLTAPEAKVLTGIIEDSHHGSVDLANMGVHHVQLYKNGDIKVLKALPGKRLQWEDELDLADAQENAQEFLSQGLPKLKLNEDGTLAVVESRKP
jgi:hypothetical protein